MCVTSPSLVASGVLGVPCTVRFRRVVSSHTRSLPSPSSATQPKLLRCVKSPPDGRRSQVAKYLCRQLEADVDVEAEAEAEHSPRAYPSPGPRPRPDPDQNRSPSVRVCSAAQCRDAASLPRKVGRVGREVYRGDFGSALGGGKAPSRCMWVRMCVYVCVCVGLDVCQVCGCVYIWMLSGILK